MLEVLVALTLVTFFLSGITIIQLYSIRNTEFSQAKSNATVLARQQLERVRIYRDTAGEGAIPTLFDICPESRACYMNESITPEAIPNGTYEQSFFVKLSESDECTRQQITPVPTYFMAVSKTRWNRYANVTPPPEVELNTCFSDWR